MPLSTFTDDALADHDTVSLRSALASGQVSAEEVREAAVARAEAAEVLNAVVSWLAPREVAPGPYSGIPTFIKDNEDIEGSITTHGSRATPRGPALAPSRWVRQWDSLGFQTLGKSALPEFGLTATTESLAHGATLNPWNLEVTTGSSSGGAAALVAAGVVPIAHANDGGGSIRIPAACCGLVGLKPTRGRLVQPESMDQLPVKIVTQGVLTRTVRDTVDFYQQMALAYPSDLPPIGPTSDPKPLRIGVLTSGIAGLPVDPRVQHAVEDAASVCEVLGHHIEPIENPFDDRIAQDFLRYWGMLAFSLNKFGGQIFGKEFKPELMEPFSRYLGTFFSSVAVGIPGSLRRLRRFGPVYDAAFGDFDLLLSPVLATPPVPIGYMGPEVDPREHLVRVLRFACFTALQNVSGAPAISLPMAATADGLPIGVHFAARVGQEQMLLDLAASLEQAVGWPRIDSVATSA